MGVSIFVITLKLFIFTFFVIVLWIDFVTVGVVLHFRLLVVFLEEFLGVVQLVVGHLAVVERKVIFIFIIL